MRNLLTMGTFAFAMGCSEQEQTLQNIQDVYPEENEEFQTETETEEQSPESHDQDQFNDQQESDEAVTDDRLCSGNIISAEAVEEMLIHTAPRENETIYGIYNRIDSIASLFERCEDPWGMFPTTYRHITNRIIEAIDGQEIEDQEWGREIVLDFASRYFANLEAALTNQEPSYAWKQYYYLADQDDVSRTRAVVVAMVAHLTLDLPYSLVAIDSTEDHKDDYFVLGELMIEITPDFLDELEKYYHTDASELLNGFFFGDWVDGVYGQDTMITLSYQTIRTKSWNNRWYLEQGWGAPIAEAEIYTAFWAIDGILATLDATGKID